MPDLVSQLQTLAASCGGTFSISVRSIRKAVDLRLNDDARMPAASTIKVPIIVEAMRQVRNGRLALDCEYRISREQCCAGSGVIAHLHDGLTLTLLDLLTLMIITSDNTATNMAIDIVGMDNVNVMLRGFGYPGTTLMRKMYDWEGVAAGRDNWIVAGEVTDLLSRVTRDEAVGAPYDGQILDIMRRQLYSDVLGMFLPEGVLANKTGSVHKAVNDCGVVSTPYFCYSIAVMTNEVAVAGDARIAIGRISKMVFDFVAAQNL